MNAPRPDKREETIPTRQSLLERLKNRDDSQSWRGFFDQYWRLIYNVARKAGLTEDESEEVVQETVIAVSRNIDRFQYDPQRGSFKGWLMKMTRWRILDQFRSRAQERKMGARSAGTADELERTATVERVADPNDAGIHALWDAEWKNNLLETAIEHVKSQVHPRHFQVFHFYVIKQQPVQTVSRMFGVNPAKIYLIKHRISALIKKQIKRLEKNWITL